MLEALSLLVIGFSTLFSSYISKGRLTIFKRAQIGENEAVLLGKVVDVNSRFSSCPNQRFIYGSDCGESSCYGSPGYMVSWVQTRVQVVTLQA